MYFIRVCIACAVVLIVGATAVFAKLVDLHHAPYVRVDDDLTVGMYCRVSSGSAGKSTTVLDTLIETIPIAGVVGPLVKKALSQALGEEVGKVVLKNGDAYCAWMYLKAVPKRVTRPYLRRLDFVDHGGLLTCTVGGFCVEDTDRARTSGALQLRLYDGGKPLAEGKGQRTTQCNDHTRCWTQGVPGNDKATRESTGLVACLELKRKNGNVVSVLFAQGKLPDKIKATQGDLAENVTCEKRLTL